MSFLKRLSHPRLTLPAVALCALLAAHAELPQFLQHAIGGSAIEAALYRLMQMPGGSFLYPRPPKEAQAELGKLISTDSNSAELYSLRAKAEEQALDFTAAESDWKAYAAHASDKANAELQLANFYSRRVQPQAEVNALLEAAKASASAAEKFVAADHQASWQAFERITEVADKDALSPEVTRSAYEAWWRRYPQEPAVSQKYFLWLLSKKDDSAATVLIDRYRKAYPNDAIFPVKATAQVAVQSGKQEDALGIYDHAFQPLWPQELIDAYFSLLSRQHSQRAFAAAARDRVAKNQDDYASLARVFWYERESGRKDAAQHVIDQYRASKDSRHGSWTADELYTLMTLMTRSGNSPEAARYAYALYNVPSNPVVAGSTAQQVGLAAMCNILLTAPDQPIVLGSHNLSMLRDIATVDQGPGFWNGILSIWMNSSNPSYELSLEEGKAQPYFRRTEAASLLQRLDDRFPAEPTRAALHASLIGALAEYGESDEVIHSGQQFLKDFPHAEQRTDVAFLMADAFQRKQDSGSEFALYDSMLLELAAQTDGMPLTAAAVAAGPQPASSPSTEEADDTSADGAGTARVASDAFQVTVATPVLAASGAIAYKSLLERYLGRLVATGHTEQALAVLRKQIDRNPNDPAIYERLAEFLEQTNLSAQQEEVYKAAMARFQDTSWASKLARFYLRHKQQTELAALTQRVTDTFSGMDLDSYFAQSGGTGPQMFLQVNLYASKRFPHDLVFVRNLLHAHNAKETRNTAAANTLLGAHWWEAEDLRARFFEHLQQTGTLEAEIAKLKMISATEDNPAALREMAEAEMWSSHFEQSAAPLEQAVRLYPADVELDSRAVSIFRSLAYYEPSNTARALAIQKNLIAENPSDLDRLATAGDILADSGAEGTPGHEDLAAAAPFWTRMAQVHPGDPDGYLQSSTVFWDYFQFDTALTQLRAARTALHRPEIYSYEAGAIDEGKRDFAAAIQEYMAGALNGDRECRVRLLQLASNKEFATPVWTAVSHGGEQEAPLLLREDVLEAEHRDAEIPPLLLSELAVASRPDDVAIIAGRALSRGLNEVYRQAIEKQIGLTADDVEKMQLQYTLALALEQRKDLASASRIIDSVYAAHPRILGVVRSTVDYDWRSGRRDQAIAVLREAAAAARPELSRKLTLEAAEKASSTGNEGVARTLLAPLLTISPFDAQLLPAMASTYAQGGDNAGLRDFYLAKLADLKASMTPAQRRSTEAMLRRGLIPALTQLHDNAGATEQYIALLSAYPEDTGLISEAALYAQNYGTLPRLTSFLDTTVKTSPRDSRFAAMQAQVVTVAGDLPAAADAWKRAVTIRSDRLDWYESKVSVDLHLDRLDDAAADDERLYVLSYKDNTWMIDVARIRARQGRTDEAVKALQTAFLSGHTPTAGNNFAIASCLAEWNMLSQAQPFAERGLELAGGDLLSKDSEGAATYARLLTRLRKTDVAFATLAKARDAAHVSPSSPAVIVAQVQSQGLASVTDAEWRKKAAAQLAADADSGYRVAMRAIAQTAGAYFTPEEKVTFAMQLSAAASEADLAELAGLAGLKQMQADALVKAMMRHDANSNTAERAYIHLQISRLQFRELGHTLESYAAQLPANARGAVGRQVADAYRNAGDSAGEVRVLLAMPGTRTDPMLRERLLQLLLKRDPERLFTFAAHNDASGDTVANFVVAQADEKQALSTVSARGSMMSPVWNSVYRSLMGLYFGDMSSATDVAFHTALAENTIGDRLAAPAKKDIVLTGEQWFFLADRYGVFRMQGGPGDPEDFAAAGLEHSAGAEDYLRLARSYVDAKRIDAALMEYGHARELGEDALLDEEVARVLWNSGRREAALAAWKDVIETASVKTSAGSGDAEALAEQIVSDTHKAGALPQLRGSITNLLKTCMVQFGAQGSDDLLRAAYRTSPDAKQGAAWVLEISAGAKDATTRLQMLNDLRNASWLGAEAHMKLMEQELAIARVTPPLPYSGITLSNLQVELAGLYVAKHRDVEAESLLAEVSPEARKSDDYIGARLIAAAHRGSLAGVLAGYAQNSKEQTSIPSDAFRSAAQQLQREGDLRGALTLQEALFDDALAHDKASAADYIGLAELQFKLNSVADAVALLHRLTLTFNDGDGTDPTDAAARLLESTQHWTEALPFLQSLHNAAPWNAQLTIRLVEARLHAGGDVDAARESLRAIAASPTATFTDRVQSAVDLRAHANTSFGSAELDLLARDHPPTLAEASRPYFVEARLAAAGVERPVVSQATSETLLREALAIDPDGEHSQVVRATIFRLEIALHHDALALAAVEPIRSALETPTETSVAMDETSEASADDGSPKWINNADRSTLLVDIAAAARQQGDSARSMSDLRLAVDLARNTSAAAQIPTWQRALAEQRRIEQRDAENATRRPIVSAQVMQSNLVRPRLGSTSEAQ